MKKLYCFDFDGTLTYRDTMFSFLKFYNSKRFYFQLVKHIPLFILLKFRLLDPAMVKRSFISGVLKKGLKQEIEEKANSFFEENFPKIIRNNALDFIHQIDRKNTECFIVTASLDIWVKPFAEHFKMKLIATKAEYIDGRFSGKFLTKNCNGEEKVSRIKQEIEGQKFDKIIAFGDTEGDLAMLKFSNEGHFKFFH